MGTVTIGIDIGQMHERSAIAVVEAATRRQGDGGDAANGGAVETYHTARHLERLPVGTASPALATRLKEILTGLRARGMGYTVVADATGVGQPVIDVLARGAGVALTPVYFTHGDRRVEQEGYVTLGKGWLVSRLQALLQTGCLLLPQTADAHALASDLLAYEITMSEQANDTYGAFRVGAHDDLITALGLAVQGQERPTPGWSPGMRARGGWFRESGASGASGGSGALGAGARRARGWGGLPS